MTDQEYIGKMLEFLGGDAEALAFCEIVEYIIHLWDDLIDEDIARSQDDINQAFMLALVALPSNPFYRKHQQKLTGFFENAIIKWLDANKMERRAEESIQAMAFTLRADIIHLLNYVAYLVRGYMWSATHGVEMREFLAKRFSFEKQYIKFKEEMKDA